MRPSQLLRRLEDAVLRRLGKLRDPYEERLVRLRARGVRIGDGCWIHTDEFSTEPYLIEIGDRVAIAAGVKFTTHEGVAWLLRRDHAGLQVFGRIRVGSDSVIGLDSIVLAGSDIGERCVVGAGSVVKGKVPDGSVVAGNPARFVRSTDDLLGKLRAHPDRLDLFDVEASERERRLRRHFALH
jgi:acetyltransferase-like isoleucine patch superfamily enzyme